MDPRSVQAIIPLAGPELPYDRFVDGIRPLRRPARRGVFQCFRTLTGVAPWTQAAASDYLETRSRAQRPHDGTILMSEPAGNLVWLSHPRLTASAMSALPAWLWSIDATRLLWANPAGAAIFDAPTSTAIRASTFGSRGPAAIQLARLAATLPPDGAMRFERLRGLGAGIGGVLTCACSCITLSDQTRAIWWPRPSARATIFP